MTGACEIDVRFMAPPSEFDGCFTTFYRMQITVEGGGLVSDHLQPEWANLRFFRDRPPRAQLPGGRLLDESSFTATGPSSLPLAFDIGTTRMWGVGLFPLGWARFVGVDASNYANTLVDGRTDPAMRRFTPLADSLFGPEPDDEAEFARIVDHFRLMDRPVRDEPRIRALHEALVDPDVATVAELAERSHTTPRTLERLSKRHFGFAPKLLLRRQRFMRSLTSYMLSESSAWSEVIDGHYHDQAHFVHDFEAFMTMTPSRYAALEHPVLKAFMAERARVWGSPAQTLDQPGATRREA